MEFFVNLLNGWGMPLVRGGGCATALRWARTRSALSTPATTPSPAAGALWCPIAVNGANHDTKFHEESITRS
jgi:hypothetical protein